MRAVKIISQGQASVVSDVPTPRSRPGYVRAKPHAWGINPTDHHHLHGMGGPGTTLGVDFAGVVLEVGEGVTKFKVGDEVTGVCHGGNCAEPEDGAFAEVVVCKEVALLHKPKSWSWAEAAGFGSGIATVGQVFRHVLGFGPGDGKRTKILIYGGSSGTGTLAIQIVKELGFEVLTTCSPANFDLVHSRGADYVFDYRDPASPDAIHQVTGDELTYVVDCIGTSDTAAFCAPLLSSKGGRYHSIKAPLPEIFKQLRPEESIQATLSMGYKLLGDEFWLPDGRVFEVSPDDYEFAKRWQDEVESFWLKEDRIKPHPPDVRPGGIDGIIEQVNAVSTLGPSGKKIALLAQS